MFSTQEYLDKKTGPHGVLGRLSYLQSLVSEFQDTDSEDSKEQVFKYLILCNVFYDSLIIGLLLSVFLYKLDFSFKIFIYKWQTKI